MITTRAKKEITKKCHYKYFAILNYIYNKITFTFLIDLYIHDWPWEKLDITLSDLKQI